MSSKKIRRIILSVSLMCTVILLFAPSTLDAQSKSSKQKIDRLPRVGKIKNYEATGLMVGCANYYFHWKKGDDAYGFLARGDGSNAWLNLDGRDTRLKLVKANQEKQIFDYRRGNLRIHVVIKGRETDDDFTLQLKVSLRKGRAVRIYQAVGYSDC